MDAAEEWRLSDLVTSVLDLCLFADDAFLFSSLNRELQQTLKFKMSKHMKLLIIKSLLCSVITGNVPSKNNLSGSKNPLKWLGKKV